MIDTLRAYTNHSILGILIEGYPALIKSIVDVIYSIAKGILLQLAISIPLFYLHHNLFALGFVVGFIFDKQVRAIVEKVNVVYNAKRSQLEKVIFYGGGGFLAILTMPTSMVIATLYYSAQWGARLYQTCFTESLPASSPHASATLTPLKDVSLSGPPMPEIKTDATQVLG